MLTCSCLFFFLSSFFLLFPISPLFFGYAASLYRNVFSGKSDEDEKVEESVVEMAT